MHSSFLRWCLGALENTPAVALYMELGQQTLASRWDKLIISFTARIDEGSRQRISRRVLVMSRASSTAWMRGLCATITSLTGSEASARNPDMDMKTILNDDCERVMDRDERNAAGEVEHMPSLVTYRRLRLWENISEARAWSRKKVGMRSHRYMERYLDTFDATGRQLKFRAQTDTILWGERWALIRGDPALSVCTLCHRGATQSVQHIFSDCDGLAHERKKMISRIAQLLHTHPADIGPDDFTLMLSGQRMLYLLGLTTGNLELDDTIDAACHFFLRIANRRILSQRQQDDDSADASQDPVRHDAQQT